MKKILLFFIITSGFSFSLIKIGNAFDSSTSTTYNPSEDFVKSLVADGEQYYILPDDIVNFRCHYSDSWIHYTGWEVYIHTKKSTQDFLFTRHVANNRNDCGAFMTKEIDTIRKAYQSGKYLRFDFNPYSGIGHFVLTPFFLRRILPKT